MSIIYSAIVSHSPLLIPEIGQENQKKLQETITAYQKVAEKLRELKPDTIIVLSPHGLIQENSFTLNMSPDFQINFEEFGELSNKFKLAGDVELSLNIKQQLEAKTNLQMISEPVLDSGASIPLFLLTKDIPEVKIIPLYHSRQDLRKHYEFGKLLRSILEQSSKRIVVLASVSLSHRLSTESPSGFSAQAKKFDKKIIKAIQDDKIENILSLDEELIIEVQETGLRPIIILYGLIDGIEKKIRLLSYQDAFGVGNLIADFIF